MTSYTEISLDTPRGYHIPSLSWIEETDREILLCVRGFGGGRFSSVVEGIAHLLAPRGIGTFSFTWPAHGDSDASGDMLTVENCLADLEDVVGYLKNRYPGKNLSCFATSFGGYMAVVYHQRHPEEFGKIILRSPAVGMAQILLRFMTKEQKSAFLAGEKLDFGFGENSLVLGRSYYDSLLRHPVPEMQVRVPEKFAIIQGDADEIVPPSDVRRFAERNQIPVYWVKGADHQYTNPDGLQAVFAYTKQLMAAEPV